MRDATLLLLLPLALATGCSPVPGGHGEEDAGGDTDADADADTDSDTDADTDADTGDTDTTTDQGCDDSPVVGHWEGTYEGTGESDLLGPDPFPLNGIVSFDVVCEEKLVLNGTMEGLESDEVPFVATLSGEYDEAENLLEAELVGEALTFEGTGTMTGSVTDTDPMTMAGTWTAESEVLEATAEGTWQAIME